MSEEAALARRSEGGRTRFLNVDLDLRAARSLRPLVEAFGDRVLVLYEGREGETFAAHLELARSYRKGADALLRAFAALVETLPRPARELWDGAESRSLNLGIQAGSSPRSHAIEIRAETLARLARLGAALAITTYAAER